MAGELDSIIYGGDLTFFLDSKPVAFSTDAKLSVKMGTREISNKDTPDWVARRKTRLDWTGSGTAYLSDVLSASGTNTFDMLYDAMIDGDAIDVVWAVATGSPFAQTPHATQKKYTGKAIITSLDPSAPDGDTASFTYSLEGDGTALVKS